VECSELRQSLAAYLAQALTDEEALAVEAHFNQCEACRQEWMELRCLGFDLDDPELQRLVLSEPSPLPEGFTDQVMSRIRMEQPAGLNVVWPWLRRPWSRRQIASVAYAMSATMVVISASELLFLWTQTTDLLESWMIHAQAYWDSAAAHVDGLSAYVAAIWQWLSQLM
jgi:anti-sigma factor RsiW